MRAFLIAFFMCTVLGTYGPAAHAHGAGHGSAMSCPGQTSPDDHHGKQVPDLACCCFGMCLGTVLPDPQRATVAARETSLPDAFVVAMSGSVLRPPRPPPKA